jgi:hypothetical protein
MSMADAGMTKEEADHLLQAALEALVWLMKRAQSESVRLAACQECLTRISAYQDEFESASVMSSIASRLDALAGKRSGLSDG